MPRNRIERIQDSVHGLMEFRGMETVVIDLLRTPEIQRLRRIRQLGLAHLVFPGAEHSRLVHSLGVAYLAIRFARHIQEACRGVYSSELLPGDSAVRDLATAALCHDIGHGAFSHAWEREVIGDHFDRTQWVQALGLDLNDELLAPLKWHELVAQAFLVRQDGPLHDLLEQHEEGFSDRLRRLLVGEYYLPYLPMLLHGDVDVDRADFLKRDTQQCGVAYGDYDLNWLISTSTIGETNDRHLVLGFGRKALRVVEHFLTARRALYETVYYHKTVRCAEGMVSLFLKRLKLIIKEFPDLRVEGFVRPLVRMIEGEAVSSTELLSLDDFSVSVLIDTIVRTKNMDLIAADLGRRILERDLFKLVPCSQSRLQDFLLDPDGFAKINEAVAPHCGPIDPTYYYHIDKSSFSMLSTSPGEISYFVDDDRRATPVHDHESLRLHTRGKEEHIRLFTLREAVQDVAKILR